MTEFVPGRELSRGFFLEAARPVLDRVFPNLMYSAGLLGYGSDVIGFDDIVSTDHMWGPRFYLFLRAEDMSLKGDLMDAFSSRLPETYRGWPVNFSTPDVPGGIRAMEKSDGRGVHPLIWIETIPNYLTREIGVRDVSEMTPARWLSVAEHRLLSLASADLYVDDLNLSRQIEALKAFPPEVRLYKIASQWSIIASEQAFSRRCSLHGDEIGSKLIAARIAERLMRLMFLYENAYAPYSKWFSSAFQRLPNSEKMADTIKMTLSAEDGANREAALVSAMCIAADAHNASGLTPPVPYSIEKYYDRDILVIWADRFAEVTTSALQGTALEGVPLFGQVSDIGGLCEAADNPQAAEKLMRLYAKDSEAPPASVR